MIRSPRRTRSIRPTRSIRWPIRWIALLVVAPVACSQPMDDRPPPPPPAPGAPIDATLAAEGEALYRSKGCLACHTVPGGGRSVGPDLAGVMERRSYEWTRAIIANPDSMLAEDPIARQLLEEYRIRMTYQRISPYEVRAVIEYLRQHPED